MASRVRLWKVELQKLADETRPDDSRLPLSAGHQQVEQDRASPVLPHHAELARPAAADRVAVVELIGHTSTPSGLRVKAKLDSKKYPTGVVIKSAQMKTLAISQRIPRRMELRSPSATKLTI